MKKYKHPTITLKHSLSLMPQVQPVSTSIKCDFEYGTEGETLSDSGKRVFIKHSIGKLINLLEER